MKIKVCTDKNSPYRCISMNLLLIDINEYKNVKT